MSNKLLINIVIANLLWSFAPIIVSGLVLEVSIIMIIFLRFLMASIVLFLLSLIFTIYNNKLTQNSRISLKILMKNLLHPNRRFYSIKNIYYYWLLGFLGIIVHIIFSFLTLKVTSISFYVSGFLLCIIFIAFYEKGVNFEKFDIFKILYIIMLTFSIIIIILVSVAGGILKGKPITFNAVLYLLIFSITTSFLYIAINRDAYSKNEAQIITKNKYYQIPRLLIKMALAFFLGSISMIPFALVVGILPFQNELKYESIMFFEQFSNFFSILGRWEILYLLFFSTLIPYLLLFITNTIWKSENLTYSQWSSILSLIDPMGSILFSVIILREYFPPELLLIIIFLLLITIIFRYSHEVKNLVKANLLITLEKGSSESIISRILKYYGIMKISALIGTHDLIVDVKTNSIKDLYFLVDKRLKPIDQIKKIDILFINKIEKFSLET